MMRIPAMFALSAAMAGCQATDKNAVERASADLADDGSYQLAWDGTAGPVDIYLGQRPYAAKETMRLLVDDDRDGRAAIQLPAKGRPYFYVVADGGSGVWTAERVLPLEGGVNFRDLGGYETADGHRVKWGKLFRSGSMAGLTPADYDYLSDLGIQVVCDLRTNGERADAPNEWAKSRDIGYWSRDYGMSQGELGKLLSEDATPETAKAVMVELYRDLPYEQAPAYRAIFDRLAGGEIPLAFNCSAGKDRAGVAAALILSALNVPRETIISDYELTNEAFDIRKAERGKASSGELANPLANMPAELTAPLGTADPDYIRSAFAGIEQRSGSVSNYLRSEVGVTASELAAIRKQLLE